MSQPFLGSLTHSHAQWVPAQYLSLLLPAAIHPFSAHSPGRSLWSLGFWKSHLTNLECLQPVAHTCHLSPLVIHMRLFRPWLEMLEGSRTPFCIFGIVNHAFFFKSVFTWEVSELNQITDFRAFGYSFRAWKKLMEKWLALKFLQIRYLAWIN